MIVWTKEFETGSAKLDDQHRTLIDNINLLEDLAVTAKASPKEREIAVSLVVYLEAYANLHFQVEEQCMESYRCPVHALNQWEHERFRQFIQDYKREYELNGFSAERLQSLHQVMSKWIQEHILRIDTQLKPCLAKQAAA